MNIIHVCNINANTALLTRFVHWMCECGVIAVHMALCSPVSRFNGELV